MAGWQEVWREFCRNFADEGLVALLEALESDDGRVVQGDSVIPDWGVSGSSMPVARCCPVAFAEWQGGSLCTVGEVCDAFYEVCCLVNHAVGKSLAHATVINAIDGWSREEMRTNLIPEIEAEIQRRSDVG